MRRVCFLNGIAVAGVVMLLSGCITSPEEQEAIRQAELEDRVRLQAMIDAGECRERHRTGSRTRIVYECGEVPDEVLEDTREIMRELYRAGGRCSDC